MLADQDQEGRLEGLFRVGQVAENVLANAQHHRSMAQHEHFKGGLRRRVTLAGKPIEELPVGKTTSGPGFEQRLDVAVRRDR